MLYCYVTNKINSKKYKIIIFVGLEEDIRICATIREITSKSMKSLTVNFQDQCTSICITM